MEDRIFQIIVACIPVLGAIITGFVVPWIKSKIGNEKLNTYITWVENAVKAAEIIFTGEEKSGEKKKAYVMTFLNNLINDKRVVLTQEQINILVESAVTQLKLAEKAVEE